MFFVLYYFIQSRLIHFVLLLQNELHINNKYWASIISLMKRKKLFGQHNSSVAFVALCWTARTKVSAGSKNLQRAP